MGLALGRLSDYDWGVTLPGWYVDWSVHQQTLPSPGTRFAQIVRLYGGHYRPELDVIRQAARNTPGSLWLIGNEPDVMWQDNATPEHYAATYAQLYHAIKEVDPTAQIAVAGVSQPTPLRMAYLDRVWTAYQAQQGREMPVDVWNIHAFILREERGSWGVGIPPGMADAHGRLYEIADHADLAIFQQQLRDFRRWMSDHGQRMKPLIVSEYGILMPESYGFPAALVTDFLVSTFDWFLTARDTETGFPQDDNRLIQAFCWYSVADTTYPTSNLFDPISGDVTPAGEVFRAYVAGLPE